MTNPHSAGLQAGRYTMTSIVIWKKLLKTQRRAQSKTYLRGLLCHILFNSLPLLTRSKICVWCIFCTRWKQPSRKLKLTSQVYGEFLKLLNCTLFQNAFNLFKIFGIASFRGSTPYQWERERESLSFQRL